MFGRFPASFTSRLYFRSQKDCQPCQLGKGEDWHLDMNHGALGGRRPSSGQYASFPTGVNESPAAPEYQSGPKRNSRLARGLTSMTQTCSSLMTGEYSSYCHYSSSPRAIHALVWSVVCRLSTRWGLWRIGCHGICWEPCPLLCSIIPGIKTWRP